MEYRSYALPLFVLIAGFLLSAQAYNFYAGGKDGWVLKPSEGYVQWSQRNRFQISDSLVFKYNKDTDSVLVVSKEDYDSCSVANPILKLEGGESSYKFARSGKFYFITGNQSNCQAGQKLTTTVITPRTPGSPPPSPSSTAPSGSPGGTAPPSPPGMVPSTAPMSSPPTPSRSHGMTPPSSPSASPPAPASMVPSSGGPSIAPVSPPSLVPSNAPEGSPLASPPSPPGMSPANAPSTFPGMAPSPTSGEPSAVPGGGMGMPPAGSPGGSDSIAPAAGNYASVIVSSNKVVLGLCLLVTTVALGSSIV